MKIVPFPSPTTILAEIDAIKALAERMRALDATPMLPCAICREGDPCWWHRSRTMRREDGSVSE